MDRMEGVMEMEELPSILWASDYNLQFNQDWICMIVKVVARALRRLCTTRALCNYAKTSKPQLQQQHPSSHSRTIHIRSKQNNTKRIQSERPEQQLKLSLQAWTQQLRVDTLEQLKPLLELALSHKSTHLAMYLRKLNQHLSSSFFLHRSFFKEADIKVNSFSANLSIQVPEFIQILRFRGTIRELQGQMSFLHNFGFEKKAGILAATFIHNRDFTFSQAVLAMRLILPLGGVSLLLLMNFIKFFKEVAAGEKATQTIKMEHLLYLLGLKFLKRNEMIIQKILLDHVLHYLLTNMAKLIKNQTPTIKIETLCTLLCFDSRNNYRSDPNAKRHWTIALLKDLEELMDGGWARELWGEDAEQPGLMAVEVVYILQCISFARQNMLDFQCLHDSAVSFETKALQQFEQECHKLHAKEISNEHNLEKLMRFVFNPYICPQWINKKSYREMIFGHILKKSITKDQTIEALVNLTNSNPEDYQHKLRLLQLGQVIITKQIEKGIVSQALILTFIQRASPQFALNLIQSIPKDDLAPQRQIFLSFCTNCCKDQFESTSFSTQSASDLIKCIYSLAKASQTQKGYEVALRMMEDNFDFLSSALLSEDSSMANRSQMNPLLSEEAYYVSWIVFINLSNGKEVNPILTAYFERLLKNDIIKFELLSNSYQLPYPRTTHFATPVLTTHRTYDALNFIINFFAEEKHNYFVWDILLKRLSCQPVAVRQQCFPLLEVSFLRAFRKEKARKVVMVTALSSHIAGGVVVATRLKLQALLQTAIDQLLVSEELIEYHYTCYLLLVCNALAADILSPKYFDKIMLHSLNKDPKMRHTCSLMLLYGASLLSRNEIGGVMEPKVIYQQSNYLRFLIKNGYIVAPRYVQKLPTAGKKEVELTARLLAIIFSLGVIQAIRLQEAVAKLLQGPLQFGEWRCVANCYTPENYSLQLKQENAFRNMVTQLLIGKVIHYSKLGLLSKAEENYFIDKFK